MGIIGIKGVKKFTMGGKSILGNIYLFVDYLYISEISEIRIHLIFELDLLYRTRFRFEKLKKI